MTETTMPKKAKKLQAEVQQRYLHQEYAFEFLASLPLTRLIGYVGAVRDVLLVIGDFLPDEESALRGVTRSLSELATYSSAPSTPGGGFVPQRSLSGTVMRSSMEAALAIGRSKSPDEVGKRASASASDGHGSDEEGNRLSPFRRAARRLRRSGSLAGIIERRGTSSERMSQSGKMSSKRLAAADETGNDSHSESDSDDDGDASAEGERGGGSVKSDSTDADRKGAPEPPLSPTGRTATEDISPRSESSDSASTPRRRKRATSVVVHSELSAPVAPLYVTYDRVAALAERKTIESQREPDENEHLRAATLEKVSSLKIYFRQHYQDVLLYAQQRRARMDHLHVQINSGGLTPVQMATMYGEHCERETGILRMRRVRPKLRDFTMLALIGRGGFGEVYLCRKTDTHQVLVIKKVKKSTLIERNMVESIRTERQVLKDTNSEWLVRLLYSFQDKNHLYLGMEYVPGGNLATLLENLDFSEAEARVYSAEMIMAVSELHRLGFIHRDLKPDNFLISRYGHLKLADFGLSKPGANVDDSNATLAGLPIRVHLIDGTYKAIPLEEHTRARDVVNALTAKLRVPDDERSMWFIFVVGSETQSQRALKPDELLMPLVRRWDALANRFGIESHHFLMRKLGGGGSSPQRAATTAAKPNGHDDASARLKFRELRSRLRSTRTDNKKLAFSVVGSPHYMAPEVIATDGYTHSVDYWSVGCLIYEMLCGVPPFTGDTPDEVFANIMEYERTLQFPAEDDDVSISATAEQFLRCVLTNADKRLDFRAMRQHEWFKSIDFDRLLELEPPFVPVLEDEADTTYFENAVESTDSKGSSIGGDQSKSSGGADFSDFMFTRYSTMFRN